MKITLRRKNITAGCLPCAVANKVKISLNETRVCWSMISVWLTHSFTVKSHGHKGTTFHHISGLSKTLGWDKVQGWMVGGTNMTIMLNNKYINLLGCGLSEKGNTMDSFSNVSIYLVL